MFRTDCPACRVAPARRHHACAAGRVWCPGRAGRSPASGLVLPFQRFQGSRVCGRCGGALRLSARWSQCWRHPSLGTLALASGFLGLLSLGLYWLFAEPVPPAPRATISLLSSEGPASQSFGEAISANLIRQVEPPVSMASVSRSPAPSELLSRVLPRAAVCYDRGDWSCSVRELSIFGPRPDQPEVRDLLFATHYNLGLELARAGRLDEAQRALDAALAVQPDDPRALGQRRLATLYASGTERLRSGDWAEASAFFQQVYDIDQEYLEVRQVLTSSRLGWARQLQASEQREEALVQYQKLLALEPEHLEASLALATHPAAQEPVLLSAPLPVSPAAPRPQPRAATPTPQPIARQDRQARQQNPPSIGFNLSLPGFSVCSGGACPSPRPTSTPDSLSGLQRERAGERR